MWEIMHNIIDKKSPSDNYSFTSFLLNSFYVLLFFNKYSNILTGMAADTWMLKIHLYWNNDEKKCSLHWRP